MTTFIAFAINIALFSVFPLYATTMTARFRNPALYAYMGIILVVGGLAGAIFSFPLTQNTFVSGGNLAYGAFMMTAVMLIISERNMITFRNMLRLLILVDVFVYAGFNYTAWLLDSGLVTKPVPIPSDIFNVSMYVLLLGGTLILIEIVLLMIIFIKARRLTSKLSNLAVIYTIAFIAILCLDGVLFPVIALNSHPELTRIIVGNVTGKAIMAACYSVPLLIFYFMSRKQFAEFVGSPLPLNELLRAPRKKLLDTLYQYELRDRQSQQDKQKLREQAETDSLTGLANRGKFNQTLDDQWQICKKTQTPLTLVIGDIDYFKQFNDTYGHERGDNCLQRVAELWRSTLENDVELAARIGGEEFALLFPNSTFDEISARLQTFRMKLKEASISHEASEVSTQVTFSVGVSSVIPNDDLSIRDLYISADSNLYRAKNSGRNTINFEATP
ncbi:GGDEF domain-containing protein [Marinomonas mediterranea]|jgi:diguanylate cyclase (GGDEF) domain|uniref:diguanylate cyclase n=1 Tax=Marinomonas mediterranea (strain ATCC 700492 / JCM 21426 / NBRC 103028 / MMB-1) TaxID=717774 RepID=F2K0B3_MARM1|nr:GGDEF domain-containing protein [Marinomonas mediterranea]ADZ89828.1 diguanylate cyclase [Marinomonas mediterranea MMB-1]WCN16049.1 diguanylate cyclase [Marinomonas mediterranea MMB-1]